MQKVKQVMSKLSGDSANGSSRAAQQVRSQGGQPGGRLGLSAVVPAAALEPTAAAAARQPPLARGGPVDSPRQNAPLC